MSVERKQVGTFITGVAISALVMISALCVWFIYVIYIKMPTEMEVTEHHPTDLTVLVAVTPQNKRKVIEVLDSITSDRGWVRTPAAPGLNELKKREVLFFSYGRHNRDMLVTITDVKRIEELELSAFFEASDPGLVEDVIEQFVARVRDMPGVTSVEISYARDIEHAL